MTHLYVCELNLITVIDNPYYPLKPGTTYVYEGQTPDGFEHNEVAITHKTRKIMGVTTIEVHDRVWDWQFSRSVGQTKFIAVTVNGATHYVNRTYSPRSSGVNELNVAVQLDGNRNATPYAIWVDKITVKAF